MAILSKMYFNAVFGALGGLLGWMLFGVLGEKNPSTGAAFSILCISISYLDLNTLLGGAVIGGMIGYFVVSVEAIRDQSLVRFARLASYGVLISVVGGALGMYLGDRIQHFLVWLLGDTGRNLVFTMLARGLGWSLLGISIGASEGIAARSLGKFSYGTLGGLLGGFIGGALFDVFFSISRQIGQDDASTIRDVFSAIGLIITGACIGSLSALVQAAFQPANVKVMRGWQEGREYPLDKPAVLIGREEHADIALFRDMKVEKRHCHIKQVGGKYYLVNNGAPKEWTLVNEVPVADRIELKDGDRIQLGNILLKFQLRAAVNRQRGRKGAPA
jgi:hypothetical protein